MSNTDVERCPLFLALDDIIIIDHLRKTTLMPINVKQCCLIEICIFACIVFYASPMHQLHNSGKECLPAVEYCTEC